MAQVSHGSEPALHNAMWPGLVGKGSPGAEPTIDLETMLDLTANAVVAGTRFDGVDLFLFDPHVSIDAGEDELRRLRDKIASLGLVVGSLVAPVWPPTGGGAAMGGSEERRNFVTQVRKACVIGNGCVELGIRPYGVIRIDSAVSRRLGRDPEGNTRRIAATFREACDIAEDYGERLAAEGEVCWGGMHSWRRMVQLLEMVDRPKTLGYQADMAHNLLYTLGANAPEDRLLPEGYDWNDCSAARRRLSPGGHGVAAMDDRFPCRAERRDRQGIGFARQDRPSLPAHGSPGQARHRPSCRVLAS